MCCCLRAMGRFLIPMFLLILHQTRLHNAAATNESLYDFTFPSLTDTKFTAVNNTNISLTFNLVKTAGSNPKNLTVTVAKETPEHRATFCKIVVHKNGTCERSQQGCSCLDEPWTYKLTKIVDQSDNTTWRFWVDKHDTGKSLTFIISDILPEKGLTIDSPLSPNAPQDSSESKVSGEAVARTVTALSTMNVTQKMTSDGPWQHSALNLTVVTSVGIVGATTIVITSMVLVATKDCRGKARPPLETHRQMDDKTNVESSVLVEIPADLVPPPRDPSSPSVGQVMPDTSLLPVTIADGEAGHVLDNNGRHAIQTTAELNPLAIGRGPPRSWSAVVFDVAAPVAPYCNFPPPSSVVDTNTPSKQQESNYVPMYRPVVSSARGDSLTVVSPTAADNTDTGTEVVPLYENSV